MIRKLSIFSVLIFSISLSAQVKIIFEDNESYPLIDREPTIVPDSIDTVEEVTNFLCKDLDNDSLKISAIYTWIAHNIQYDISFSDLIITSKDSLIDVIFDNQKGVCYHYSLLFNKMCDIAKIEAYTIIGYTDSQRDFDLFDRGHAWNGVILDTTYYLLDVTWDKVDNRDLDTDPWLFWFLIEPSDFIQSHIPYDPIWQFLDNPITHYNFAKSDFSSLDSTGNFNFRDSISYMENLDTIQKLTAINNRIKRFGITNSELERWVNYNLKVIDSQHVRKLFKSYNQLVDKYNNYNHLKYDRATRYKEMKQSFTQVDSSLISLNNELISVNLTNEKHLNEIGRLTEKVSGMNTRLDSDREYYSRVDNSRLLQFLTR